MPKKNARRGNFQPGGRGGRRGQNLESSFVPFSGTSTPRNQRGFTLQDEARNTERDQAFWDKRLRDSKVTFVSAGQFQPDEPKNAEDALAKMTLESPKVEAEVEDSPNQDNLDLSDAVPNIEEAPQIITVEVEATRSSPDNMDVDPGFMVDVQGSGHIDTGIPPPQIRSVSPARSDSSEEVILFAGRDANGRGLSRNPKPKQVIANPIDSKIRIIEDKIHQKEELLQEVLHDKKIVVPSPQLETIQVETYATKNVGSSKLTEKGHRGRKGRNTSRAKREEDALMADYIANMLEDDSEDDEEDEPGRCKKNAGKKPSTSFLQRDLGGDNEDVWQETEGSSGELFQPKPALRSGWDRSDICDFDDMSTSDGVIGEVEQVLSKRERPSGPQYLIVWEHQSVDEARWVPAATLNSVIALSLIESFEAEEKLVAQFVGDEEDDTDDTDSDDDLDDDLADDMDDEDDLIQRKIDRMTDEQIARLFAKQEEFGYGGSELMLFDDGEDADDTEAVNPERRTSFKPVMLPSDRSRTKGSKRSKGDFPSATQLADAYDGFDVMDFDRPSLKKKPKARKGKISYDISDSDLEAKMQMAYENDRTKKKERKQEREALRAQGLLGSKNGKPDLKQKYKEGMTFRDMQEHIQAFLMTDHTTLAFPPMNKADRKVVHQLANQTRLKSKSSGNGNKRFAVLYKVQNSLVGVENVFSAEAQSSRRFAPRNDVGGRRSGGGFKRGGGGNNAGVTYRDGDIVGGSAPELGIDNKGRAMLEKMGWSSGTALGALNNKGILQPVSHVVKTTKAGLG